MTLTAQLGKITGVKLEIEDHGLLTCWVEIDKEEGSHQAFGGYSLDSYDELMDRRKGTAAGMDWVLQLMQVFGVSRLEEMTGKMCYALYEEESQLIKGIRALKIDGGREFVIAEWVALWELKS